MYYRPETNETFTTHSEIRSASPNVIFPASITDDDLAYAGVFPLVSAKPVTPAGQVAVPLSIENIDGEWTQLWNVRDATPEEIEQMKPIIPRQVTMRQARLALLSAGVLGNVASAIESLDSPHREVAQIEWEFSSTVDRDRPLVTMLGPKLGLTAEQLDQMFITAETL